LLGWDWPPDVGGGVDVGGAEPPGFDDLSVIAEELSGAAEQPTRLVRVITADKQSVDFR